MIEVPVSKGNPDARTLNEAMELKKCVRIAIEMDMRGIEWSRRMWIYSDRHGTRSVKFIDDSTAWEFGAIVPERIKPDVMKTAPLQAGITYNPSMPQGMRVGYTPSYGGSDGRRSYNDCYSIKVVEGIPVSKRVGSCDCIVYQIRISQDLTN